jgi:hypothetical protein
MTHQTTAETAERRAKAEGAIEALRTAAEEMHVGIAVGSIPLEVRPAVESWLRRLAEQRLDRSRKETATPAAVSAAVAPPTDTTHGLSVQHADALWDAVAIPGPHTPTYPEQHERVCRAVRDILDELTPARDDAVAQTALRDRIADKLTAAAYECDGKCGLSERECYDAHPITFSAMAGGTTHVDGSVTAIADAVLAELPEPADRAAVLADVERAIRAATGSCGYKAEDGCDFCNGVDAALDQVRRMADVGVTPPPALTEKGRLRAQVQVLQQDAERDQGLAKVGARCMREGHQGLIESGRATVEGHRFALSVALDLGTGATWDAIHERVKGLRRMADETATETQPPHRGDAFEQWLKARRDEWAPEGCQPWQILDQTLEEYRLHADTRTPLGEHVCEAKTVGDCECLEQPAAGARQDGTET